MIKAKPNKPTKKSSINNGTVYIQKVVERNAGNRSNGSTVVKRTKPKKPIKK